MTGAPDFTPQEMTSRLGRVRAAMLAGGVDAVITTDAANVRYVTGFRGEPRTLLITPRELVLYTSFRTQNWAERQVVALGSALELSTAAEPISDIRGRLSGMAAVIGVDQAISHRKLDRLQAEFGEHRLRPAEPVEISRRIKSHAEIEILSQAQRINEQIFEESLSQIRPGMSERAAQGVILAAMAGLEDVDRYAFMPIVANGASAWEIHHLPDATTIEENQMLLIDLGIVYRGYASDMTRVVCFGRASDEMREVHGSVCEAQEAAIAAMRPGVSTHEIDGIARELIAATGHGRSFTHGLGHSIGLETHDPGLVLSTRMPEVELQAGMVFTVEPGIYIEGGFGVRVEDVVAVTDRGTRNLTGQSRELLEIGT